MGNIRSKKGRENNKEGDDGGIAGFVIPEIIEEVSVTIKESGIRGQSFLMVASICWLCRSTCLSIDPEMDPVGSRR